MDVRCERCKTEYEFDDARITEAGVTVKCTTCSHVFKVKKKALVVTVPVEAGDELVPGGPAAPPPATTPQREWKVRQASGNVFTFKELTTLQKWIVERKVSRDDEISLTGESWKRLGNIAELASFFQVVDEAQKGSAARRASRARRRSAWMAAPTGAPQPAAPGAAARDGGAADTTPPHVPLPAVPHGPAPPRLLAAPAGQAPAPRPEPAEPASPGRAAG